MTKQIPNNPAVAEQQLLPANRDQAINVMINITENLIHFSERESMVLAQNDMMGLAVMQNEKTVITERYIQLSKEFRDRLNEFRGASPALLDKLEALQKTLGDNSRHNNRIVEQIQGKAQKKTQSVLFSAQQLGQSHKVSFAGDTLLALNEVNEGA